MAKLPPIPDELRRRTIAAVAAAWDDGCPIADYRPERQAQLAEASLRRWRSFDRRGISPLDRTGQVRDVARGMVEASGDDRRMVGRLIVDYEYLAGRVLSAIDQWQSERGEPGAAASRPRE